MLIMPTAIIVFVKPLFEIVGNRTLRSSKGTKYLNV